MSNNKSFGQRFDSYTSLLSSLIEESREVKDNIDANGYLQEEQLQADIASLLNQAFYYLRQDQLSRILSQIQTISEQIRERVNRLQCFRKDFFLPQYTLE